MNATVLTQKAYIVGIHSYSFRVGEAGEIIGIKFVKPRRLDNNMKPYNWRLAYIVLYDDGVKDCVCVEDVENGNYAIISDVQLALGQIPNQ